MIERLLRRDEQPLRRVLDIGCGGGALLEYLRRRMTVEVVGVDPKPGPGANIPIVAADAATDRLQEADVAACSLAAHHLTPEENIALIRNVGPLLPTVCNPRPDPPPHAARLVFHLHLPVDREGGGGRWTAIHPAAFMPEEFANLARKALAGTKATFSQHVSPFLSRQVIDIRYDGKPAHSSKPASVPQ